MPTYGRIVNHDPRSRRYSHPEAAPPARAVTWRRQIPILDQGQVGSCTGNALVGALGTDPLYPTVKGQALNEQLALQIYSAAEQIDGHGPYPPNDVGSSGLSVAKAAKNRGLISGYTHAFSIDACYAAIATGPFIIGVNWYESMESPDGNGLIEPSGTVVGGHEVEVVGYHPNALGAVWEIANSWGTSWGMGGYCYLSDISLRRLLSEDGDATVLIPVTAPAPAPVPAIPAEDQALLTALRAWEPGITTRCTSAGRLKTAGDAWAKAKGSA